MKKILLLLLLVPMFLSAQVTIRIISLPSNTPLGAPIYFAGSNNSWNAQDAAFALTYDSFNIPQITIPEGSGTVNTNSRAAAGRLLKEMRPADICQTAVSLLQVRLKRST